MGTTFTSKRSPTGEVPVIFKTPNVDNKITIQFDIGLKTGKDLAMAWFCHVCRPGMGTPGAWKFKLIFNGKEIQNDDSETLLDKGFNASGGASEVILIPLDDEGNVDVPKQKYGEVTAHRTSILKTVVVDSFCRSPDRHLLLRSGSSVCNFEGKSSINIIRWQVRA